MKRDKAIKKEIRELEKDIEFLDSSQTKIENILDDLAELAHCNMYVNFRALRIDVGGSVDKFYRILKTQFISTRQRLEKEMNPPNY